MKLSEHVDKLRILIQAAFDKQFARLGIGQNNTMGLEKLPPILHKKRKRFDEMLENHIGATGTYEKAREKLIEELTFTLFNRIAAIKVMESANLFPPIITKEPEHGDRSFGHKAWLEIRPDMKTEELEGIREYLKYAFDELGRTLPLYNKTFPYALLPDTISLNEIIDNFNEVEKDPQIENDIWQSDDILGWLYESYNNAKKIAFKESKAKTEYDKVSLQSQVYTPRWVVQFLVDNSLGKLYLEMYPDSEIKNRYKIANAPKVQERKTKPLNEVKLIDPASGSGNFLLYSFDLFYELYMDQIDNYGADYDESDIPRLIIENNLHGIDLDDRAIQLAQLGLYIKAKKKNRNTGNLKFNVVSSDFFLPDYEETRHIFEKGTELDHNQRELIEEIWSDLQYAYKFGSLIQLDEKLKSRLSDLEDRQDSVNRGLFTAMEIDKHKEFSKTFFVNLKAAVEQYARTASNTFLSNKTRDAITFLELLSKEYEVATANPPYTDSSDFGKDLKSYIENNYKKSFKFNINLYAAFIRRCFEFVCDRGFIAMIHPSTFMYIKTFEDVRKFIINKTHINFFVEWGYLGIFNPSVRVGSAIYILEKVQKKDKKTVFIKLNQLYEAKRYKALFEAYNQYLICGKHDFIYEISQFKLRQIESWPFIYWISKNFRDKFGGNIIIDVATVAQGLATSNNNRFLRFWWEINRNDISIDYKLDHKKWVFYAKGGSFKKWAGNIWAVVNWEDDGREIKNVVDENGKQRSRPQNQEHYFTEGITYSALGGTGMSFRYLGPNNIFDVGGSCIFPNVENPSLEFFIAYLNSKLVKYSLACLNPTVNTQVGDLKRVPFVIPEKNIENQISNLSKINIQITRWIKSMSLIEIKFKQYPFYLSIDMNIINRIKSFLNIENHLITQVLLNEAIINNKIYGVYNLNDHDRSMIQEKEGKSVGALPVSEDARKAYLYEILEIKKFPLDNIKEFIESLHALKLTLEERDSIEKEFSFLYQSNNNLEEFCIRHQVNPINVWYWFKQSNKIPKQRMNTIAMEFLADMIREILMEDEDGIIPLVPNAGEKILLDRIEEKFIEKGFSMAQYSSFDSVFGRPLNDYINKYFFKELSDHLNIFLFLPKTPFIWHLSSGPEQGIDCYIIIYKWSRDKLMQLRSVYIEQREQSLKNRQSDLANNNSAEAQNEKEKILRQLNEIESFKVKIDELLEEGYDPILDDGVGKNIAPLQQKKMIPYDVLNAGQLKKYLNADW